jgi:hypothetical protein
MIETEVIRISPVIREVCDAVVCAGFISLQSFHGPTLLTNICRTANTRGAREVRQEKWLSLSSGGGSGRFDDACFVTACQQRYRGMSSLRAAATVESNVDKAG